MFAYPKSTMEWAATLGVGVSCTMLWFDRISGLADGWTLLAAVVAGMSIAAVAFCRRSWRIAVFGAVVPSGIRRTSLDEFPGGAAALMAIATIVVLAAAHALALRTRTVTRKRQGELPH